MLQNKVSNLLKYTSADEDGVVVFDYEAAVAAGEAHKYGNILIVIIVVTFAVIFVCAAPIYIVFLCLAPFWLHLP